MRKCKLTCINCGRGRLKKDSEAFERGKIYKACNFKEIGGKHGVKELLQDPLDPKGKWQWKRNFFKCKQMKQYATLLGIPWGLDWSQGTKILWENIPTDVTSALKNYRDLHIKMCLRKKIAPKKKFYLLLGKNRREQKLLNKLIQLFSLLPLLVSHAGV